MLKGESRNYIIASFLLDLYCKPSHSQFTFICTEMEPATSPTLRSLTQGFTCDTESAKIWRSFMHLSRSCCEKTNTQHPKQPRLCKQISHPSAGKSGLFLWSMIESSRDDDFLWNVVGIFHDQVTVLFLTATCAIHFMFSCTFLIFYFVWMLFHLPLPSHYLWKLL